MGTNSSKNKKILQILENSINNPNINHKEKIKLNYKVNYYLYILLINTIF